MSPIDEHLRRTLNQHATATDDRLDLFTGVEHRARAMRRRRLAWASGATAVVVACGVVGGIALAGSGPDTVKVPVGDGGSETPTPQPTSESPTPAATASPAYELDTYDYLGWPARHGAGTAAADFADDVLWGGELPDGTFVLVRQADVGHQARAVAVINPPHGDVYTITGAVLREITQEVSFVLPGGAYPWVLVVGAPTTGQILYRDAPGGTYEPVDTIEGWALFKRTGSGDDRILVEDGDGLEGEDLYHGPIDSGPSEPDV